MLLKIVQVGNPVLRETARVLSAQELASREIRELIAAMKETMRDAPGVGLAAPQVGLALQLAVIEDREEYHKDVPAETLKERKRRPVPFHVIVNPRITFSGEPSLTFFEGCLSASGFMAEVARAETVRVECLDEHGKARVIEAEGWYARILQHEIDHLNGRLYLDRMNTRTFTSLDNFNRYWKKQSPIGD